MNYGPILFLIAISSMCLSWLGFVYTPYKQLGESTPQELTEGLYPVRSTGMANQGREIYRANGCQYCHTMQVRAADKPMWGERRTVAADYLYDYPVMLGSQRVGPDLANMGVRVRTADWHLLHLYNPEIVSKGSSMPGYSFLFEKRKATGSAEALKIPAEFKVEAGYEIIPKPEAYALVSFLTNQQYRAVVYETPVPALPKSAAAATNAPVSTGTSNAPAAAASAPLK